MVTDYFDRNGTRGQAGGAAYNEARRPRRLAMPDYPAAVAELLAAEHPTALGPGSPNAALRPRIAGAAAALPRACAAGLWLRFDFLDESHAISQEDEGNPDRDFWH